jgi:hypothetical protein
VLESFLLSVAIIQATYVVTRPGDTDAARFANGMKVMQQDAIVVCWQATMGRTPGAIPSQVLSSCSATWSGDTQRICALLETEAYGKTLTEAAQYCTSRALQDFVYPTDDQLKEIARTAPF